MSDDRMDRAARIRNMREGNRGTDDDQTDDGATEATQPATDGESAAPDSDGETTESAAGGGQTTSESTPHGTDDGTDTVSSLANGGATEATATQTDTEATSTAPSHVGSTTDTTPPDTAATDASSEATAAAQRAAASAAEVMATGAESGPTGGADTGAAAGAEDGTGGVPAETGAVPGGVSGVELPDQELLEAAMATSSVESTEGGARAAMGEESTQSAEVVRVLEFSLGDEYYCLDIEYVEEIVKRDAVTRVPNTPEFVDGVVDLRGQITTILEPKEMMDIDSDGEQNLIIVFDPEQFEEQGAVGWVVDEVRQVVPVTESEINNPPVDAEYINGVIDREEHEQFVIWVEPEDALAQATATDEE